MLYFYYFTLLRFGDNEPRDQKIAPNFVNSQQPLQIIVDARIYSEEAILDSSHTCKFEQ
jgi:hypothetical protein